MHITLGLIGKTWADVMIEAVSAACLASPSFRANLPMGLPIRVSTQSMPPATFRALVDMFAREARLAPILERMTEEFVTSRRPALQGCLQEGSTGPTIGSKIAPRPDLVYLLREGKDGLVLVFGATEITLPTFARDAVRFALAGPPFVVHDLPGQLDDAGKVVLVRRLLREGLLVRQDEALE